MNIQLIAFLQCIGICATLADDTSPANRYLRKKNRKPHGVSANSCKGLDGTSSGIVPWAEGGPTSVSNFEELKTAIANATNPSPQAKIRLCPGTITFTSDVDLTDKYFSIYCEKGGGEDDDECVLDLNGRSFFNDVVMGSDFSLEFEEVNIINGNAVSYLYTIHGVRLLQPTCISWCYANHMICEYFICFTTFKSNICGYNRVPGKEARTLLNCTQGVPSF